MAFDFGSLASYIPMDFGSGIGMLKVLLWSLIIGGGLGFLVVFLRNKIKYQYYGLVFKRRQESLEGIPQAMLVQGKAGYFKKKSGRTIFRVKYGFMPWQQVETSQLPDPKFMLGNTVVFLQVQKDNFAQAKIVVNWEGSEEEGNIFKLEPIDDSLKFDALLELSEMDRVLDTKRMTPMVVGMMVIGFIIVTGIIVLYLVGRGGV